MESMASISEHIYYGWPSHMSAKAQYYRIVTSIAKTGVDNGKARSGFEPISSESVTLKGQVYIYYPTRKGQSAIQLYTYDSEQAEKS